MGNDDSNPGTAALERVPAPVCRFGFEDGEPVVRATNERFEKTVGRLAPGERLCTIVESVLDPPDQQLSEALRDTPELVVTLAGDREASRQFAVGVTQPTDRADGILVFTALEELCRAWTEDDTALGVDHVASVVSHDLRNPLDVARARLQAARELDDDSHLDHVEQAHDRMEQIIQDVLTLARGADVVDPDEPVDLGELATDAWETVETDRATLAVADTLPTALVDADRVRRLFENLFRNAVEHGSTSPDSQARQDAVEHGSTSPPSHAQEDAVEHGSTSPDSQARQDAGRTSSSEPSVADAPEDAVEHGSTSPGSQARRNSVEHSSTSHADADASADTGRASSSEPSVADAPEDAVEHGSDSVTVRVGRLDGGGFYVEDDGPGIPPAERGRVFEPGYSTHDHGTGLGLSIVARIADVHGWTVQITDGSAGGTRFEFQHVGDG